MSASTPSRHTTWRSRARLESETDSEASYDSYASANNANHSPPQHKSNTNVRPTDVDDMNEATLRDLECPVCLDYCTPPIVQCANGHNVCASCRARVKQCAVCRAQITGVRNLFAEQMCARVRYPCRYKAEGCKEMSRTAEKSKHEAACKYAFRCFVACKVDGPKKRFEQCRWRGIYHELRHHVNSKHPTWIANSSNLNLTASLRNRCFILVNAFNELFWCILIYNFKTSSLQGYVCIIGAEEKAQSFKYEFTMQSCRNGNKCEIVNQGRVIPFAERALSGYKLDEEGEYVIVEGRTMIQRFVVGVNFVCSLQVIKDD